MNNLRIVRVSGQEIEPYITDLAKLRIFVFREFPYLYDGTMDYEKRYLRVYLDSPKSAVILVFDKDRVIGASTSLPLADENEAFKAPFAQAGFEINRMFYFGESMLYPEYRGLGIGRIFFKEREAAAQEQGYDITTFSEVVRPFDHPKRPAHWRPLDEFWKKMGYVKHPELVFFLPWKDIDEEAESKKPMVFWMKNL